MIRVIAQFFFLIFFPTLGQAGYNSQGIPATASFNFGFTDSALTDNVLGVIESPGTVFWYFEYSYISNPLIEKFPDGSNRRIVDSLHSFTLHPSLLLSEKALLSIRVPFSKISIYGEDKYDLMGDSRLQLKYRLTEHTSNWQFAVMPELLLPTGSEERYLSNGGFGGSVKFILERNFSWLTLASNLGYQWVPDASWRELDYSQQILAGLGGEISMTDQFSINAEVNGSISTDSQRDSSTGEFYFGGVYKFLKDNAFFLGASVPSLNINDNDGVRAIAGLKMVSGSSRHNKNNEPKVIMVERSKECSLKPFTATFYSRPLSEGEKNKKLPLPYKSGVKVHSRNEWKSISAIHLGEMTGMTSGGLPFVEDAQVVMAIDFADLPPRKSIKRIDHAQIKMTITKLSKDPYLGTEVICFLKEKFCSGEMIGLEHWNDTINKDFLSENKRTANNYFSKLYLDKPVATFNGRKVYSNAISMNLSGLVAGTKVSSLDLIYNNAEQELPLYMAVADDSFVSNDARLELLLSVEVCQ